MKTKILFEDTGILVIHKPSGIAVQSARIGQMDVESELRNYIVASEKKGLQKTKSNPYLGLVHRLDQPVEGLLVVAKTKETAAKLNKQLTAGSLNKKYLAVVLLQNEQIEMNTEFKDYMIKDGQLAKIIPNNVIDEKQTKNTESPKEAILQYQILNKIGNLALVDIEIKTGRFHQIRCQMAYHGMPLIGDAKYGTEQSMKISQELGVRNVALCANRIFFKNPTDGKKLDFEVQPENSAFAKFL